MKWFNEITHAVSNFVKGVKYEVQDAVDGEPGVGTQAKRVAKDLGGGIVHGAKQTWTDTKETTAKIAENVGLKEKPWYKQAWEAVVEFVQELFGASTGKYEVSEDAGKDKGHKVPDPARAQQQAAHAQTRERIKEKYGLSGGKNKSKSEPYLTKVGDGAKQDKIEHRRSKSDGDVGGHKYSEEYNNIKAKHQKSGANTENRESKPVEGDSVQKLAGGAENFSQLAQNLSGNNAANNHGKPGSRKSEMDTKKARTSEFDATGVKPGVAGRLCNFFGGGHGGRS